MIYARNARRLVCLIALIYVLVCLEANAAGRLERRSGHSSFTSSGVPEGYEARFAKYAPESYRASKISIKNGTAHPVVLGKLSRSNTIRSVGSVKDYGALNTVGAWRHQRPHEGR